MLAVLAVCLVGPFSAAYVLGPAAALLLPTVAAVLGITLGLGVQPGTFRLPDELTGVLGWPCTQQRVVQTRGGGACAAWLRISVVAAATPGACLSPPTPPCHSRPDGPAGGPLLLPPLLHELLGQAGGLLLIHPMAQVGAGGTHRGLEIDADQRRWTSGQPSDGCMLQARLACFLPCPAPGTAAGSRRRRAAASTPRAAPSQASRSAMVGLPQEDGQLLQGLKSQPQRTVVKGRRAPCPWR